MSANGVPPQIRYFIYETIESVGQLDILLWIYSHADRNWTAEEITTELRSNIQSTEKRLGQLERSGIVARETRPGSQTSAYQYKPKTPDLNHCVTELARLYKERRYSIIQMIYSKPDEALRSFSDAFKLKKDDDDDPDR